MSLDGLTTAQAKAKCGKAIVGVGKAIVKIAGAPEAPDTNVTVTAFNGKPVGRKPVILLHSYPPTVGTSGVSVLVGKLSKPEASTATGST